MVKAASLLAIPPFILPNSSGKQWDESGFNDRGAAASRSRGVDSGAGSDGSNPGMGGIL